MRGTEKRARGRERGNAEGEERNIARIVFMSYTESALFVLILH